MNVVGKCMELVLIELGVVVDGDLCLHAAMYRSDCQGYLFTTEPKKTLLYMTDNTHPCQFSSQSKVRRMQVVRLSLATLTTACTRQERSRLTNHTSSYDTDTSGSILQLIF